VSTHLQLINIIITGKDTISFMQGIYTYIPGTNHVPKQYSVAAILSLLLMVPISLAAALALMYFYIRTFRSMCAVPNIAVFCSSLTSWFPGIIIIITIIIIIIIIIIVIIIQNAMRMRHIIIYALPRSTVFFQVIS
jgi:hypothetical protein